MPKSRSSRSCAAWLAELRPEPPRLILPGSAFAALTKSAKFLIGAGLRDDQDVGRVVEPEHRRHVVGLVRDVALHRLQHHVRQVDADDVEAVGGKRVGLAPEQRATGTGLVLDHGVDRRALLLQHQLLVARRQVGFAAGRERLPVHEVGRRAGRRLRQRRHAERGREHGGEQVPDHGVSFGGDLFYLRTVNRPGETMAGALRGESTPALAGDMPIAYLERVREYYQALGYGAPYEWAHCRRRAVHAPGQAARGVPGRDRHHGRAASQRPGRSRAGRALPGERQVLRGLLRHDEPRPRPAHRSRRDRPPAHARRRSRHVVSAAGVASRRGGRPNRLGRAALSRRADQPQPAHDARRRRARDRRPLPAPTPSMRPSSSPTVRSAIRRSP